MDETVPAAEVRRQMERILDDPLFRHTQRLAGFLRFAVETSLAGDSNDLKEYTIGIHVFERPSNYSPQEDPIVRIMAGRLRAKLAEFYQSRGESDLVLLELPRGGYIPKATRRSLKHRLTVSAVEVPRHSVFVGRDREMEVLRELCSGVARGVSRMAGISGDAGMGKTSLGEDFLNELQHHSAAITGRGQCSERLAETEALAPFLEILDGFCRQEGMGQEIRSLLEKTAPAWWGLVVPSASGRETRSASYERMRRELVAFFEGLSRRQPVVLFLDDVHWAAASTCDMLRHLVSRSHAVRVLIVTTYRPGALLVPGHPFLPMKLDLERRGILREVPLAFLSRNDVDAYLAIRFPRNAFPTDLSAILHERTEGNPLFLTDLIEYLEDTGVLASQDEQWVLTATAAQVRRVIPAGTQAMINVRIGQLSQDDRNILSCGAVQGMQFDSAAAAQALSLDAALVEERLHELENVHRIVALVEETDRPGMPLSVRYRFMHVFYQNALYSALTPSRRANLSLAVASAMFDLAGKAAPAIAADLAMLYESGRDYTNAARNFVQAARNAARVFAYPEAALLCRHGLKALSVLPASTERDEQELSLLLTLGMALMTTVGYAAPEVLETYRRARELCLRLNETRRLIRVLWAIHTCEANASRLPAALEVALEMRRAADALKEPLATIESLHAEGTTLAFLGRFREARIPLERILDIAPVSRHEFRGSLYVLDPLVTSLSMLGRLRMLLGEFDSAMAHVTQSLDLAHRTGHPHSLIYATFWIGWVHHAGGDHAEALQKLDSALELARTHEVALIMEWARIVRGSALASVGRREEGIAEMRSSIQRQDALGAKLERAYCLTLLAEAMFKDGQAEQAVLLCREALEFGRLTEGRSYEPETRRVLAEALYALGAGSEALQELRDTLRETRGKGCRLFELRTAISYVRLTENATDARDSLSRVVADCEGLVNPSVLREACRLLA